MLTLIPGGRQLFDDLDALGGPGTLIITFGLAIRSTSSWAAAIDCAASWARRASSSKDTKPSAPAGLLVDGAEEVGGHAHVVQGEVVEDVERIDAFPGRRCRPMASS